MVEIANYGDKRIIKNPEQSERYGQNEPSEINLLSIRDSYSSESIGQREVGNRIAKIQDSIMSTVEKLAVYYPDGYQGVLDSMAKGPAYDHLASVIKAGKTNLA